VAHGAELVAFAEAIVTGAQTLAQSRAAVVEALGLLRSSIPATVAIRQEIESTATILADPTQIHQVLMDLCTNAVQALEENSGLIEISLRQIEAGPAEQLRYHDLAPGRYVALAVRDTGRGIPAPIRERIFEPFFTTRQVGEGTGLGLAAIHGIVTNHKGVIDVQSEEGAGSVFTIFFPSSRAGAEAAGPDDVLSIPRGSEKILYVDDEEDIVFEHAGWSQDTKTNGSGDKHYNDCNKMMLYTRDYNFEWFV